MTKLVEFTAEEMKGCPVFEADHPCEMFIWVDSDGDIVSEDYDASSYFSKKFKCNPHDRMKAICKHLFELMPKATIIKRFKNLRDNGHHIQVIDMKAGRDGQWFSSDLDAFLHTGKTEITREEIMNG